MALDAGTSVEHKVTIGYNPDRILSTMDNWINSALHAFIKVVSCYLVSFVVYMQYLSCYPVSFVG